MQQRGLYTTMNIENEEKSSSSRSRHLSKLKVLVRSLAIREEASPCRESSPIHLISPSINVIPSTETSPRSLSPTGNPLVVLSRGSSPVCVSPTATLVPSPTSRASPQNESPQYTYDEADDDAPSPKHLAKLNKQNLERDAKREIASHNNRKKFICDCTSQNCASCRSQERNINNNLTNINNNVVLSANSLTVNRVNSRHKLKQQSLSRGSFEGSSSNSPCLSRDSSSEQYTDTSGADLEVFIPETLNKNSKDRAFMLRVEQELVRLAKDTTQTHYKFPPMSSYNRMIIHRCAAYFGMDHNIESTGKCVVVNKTKNTRIPIVEFKEHIKDDVVFSEEPRRSILKRDSNSVEDYNFKSPDRQYMAERRSKCFEEREEEYAKVRRRIFNREELCLLRQMHDGAGSNDDFEWEELPWSSTESDSARFRLQLPEHCRRMAGKLTKVLSEETGETSRPFVAKNHSFGGYDGCLNRGDSILSTHSAGPRLLIKQDSGASSVSWRLSPSSSGYKSQSQMSESITPSPTPTPNQMVDSNRQDSNESSTHDKDSSVVWAVTDIQRVLKGSIIINPQTGEAVKNEDGSLYHYDPNNPPLGYVNSAAKPPPSPKKSPPQNAPPKKRSFKLSPIHKSHLTNSSTSPSLPYSPPLPLLQQQSRVFQYLTGLSDNVGQYPMYGGGGFAPPPPHENVSFYQQPCIVYAAPYNVPISPHFESRMMRRALSTTAGSESTITSIFTNNAEAQPISEVNASYYVNVPENNPVPAAYQQPAPPPYWNQQPISFDQNHPSNPTPSPQSNYMSSFPPNYLPSPAQPPPPPPANPDVLPMFPQQSLQLVYSAPPPSQPVYSNQPNIVYTQNPVYYPPQYSQNTSTPNGSGAAASSQFTSHLQEQNQQNMMHLTQSMSQMSFIHSQHPPNYVLNKMTPPHFDLRQKACTPKSKYSTGAKGFVLGSSQSSTGTNSPAATVVAGYCPPNTGMYRTPPETPPNQFGYGPGLPPLMFGQMSNVRANTPGTARSSRSPTPASEFERTRIAPQPPHVYHGMPYVFPTADNRVIPGRSQPNHFRHPPPMNKPQTFENKSHKPRRSKGNKQSTLPATK